MHAVSIMQRLIRDRIPSIHDKRLRGLMAAVEACLSRRRLTLSEVARGLPATTCVRHRIKRIDRLLGNVWFQQHGSSFYRLLSDHLLAGALEPVILVDWSDLKPDRSLLLLRATLSTHRQALVLYEEIHPLCKQNSPQVERSFLLSLRTLLGDGVRPVIVTDAGFRGPWFAQLERMGWHWVGRVRGRTYVSTRPGCWVSCRYWFARATGRAVTLGQGQIVRARPVECTLVLYRKSPQGRSSRTVHGQRRRSRLSNKCADREREPWLLAASPSLAGRAAREIVNLYRRRMRIEQSFRVLKSHQFGFGYEDSRSRHAPRIAVLLLINALAVFVAWIAGHVACHNALEAWFQSHGNHKRRSLSVVTLGCMALSEPSIRWIRSDLEATLKLLMHPPNDYTAYAQTERI